MSALSTMYLGVAICGGLKNLFSGKRKSVKKGEIAEERQSYDACLRDLVLSQPHAFANEMDVQYLLMMYPSSR